MGKEKYQIRKARKHQKILITGANGMLGQEFVRQLSKLPTKSYSLLATDKDILDITNKSTVDDVISEYRPDFIIHTAAYVDVDQAEDDKAICKKVNVEGTKNISEAAKRIGATMIYISTDYVFNGKKSKPYNESDSADPLGFYAKTKYKGEKIVAKYCKNHYIIRVAWLFGKAKGKKNFVEKMIDLSKKGALKVINDQIGSPTSTDCVATIIKELIVRSSSINEPPYGIYHLSGKGETTRYGFTKEIFKQLNRKVDVQPIKTGDFFAKAKRPAYSYLDKNKLEKELGIKIDTWERMLSKYLKTK